MTTSSFVRDRDNFSNARLTVFRFQITVTGKIVKESICEKTLGIIANNKLSWLHYLHGDYSDPKEPGLGMLFRLPPFLPKDKLEAPVLSFSRLQGLSY